MQSIMEFFRNLPRKSCTSCGKILDEQADCYTNECLDCCSDQFYTDGNR